MSVTLGMFVGISYILGTEGQMLSGNIFVEYQKFTEVSKKMENENIKALEKTLMKTFTKKQLVKIVRSELDYSMIINGDKFPVNTNTISITTPKFELQLYEYFGSDALDILPKNIINMGSMFNTLKNLKAINISTNKAKYSTKMTEIIDGRLISYKFSNLENGEIITLEIDPIIAKKIKLEVDNVVEIYYTEAKKTDENKK